MAERYFTPDEVEGLIPTLTALVGQLRDGHEEAQATRERMESEHKRLTMAGGGVLDRQRWRADQAGFEAATARVQAAIEKIHGMGGVPKDLGMGLIDFPHLRDGRVVNLCWRLGETRIEYWHGMDEGFGARKPL